LHYLTKFKVFEVKILSGFPFSKFSQKKSQGNCIFIAGLLLFE